MSLSRVGRALRAKDPETYLLSLTLPYKVQKGVMAISAVDREIASIKDSVGIKTTSKNVGIIRTEWWRDALKKVFFDGRSHLSAAQRSIQVEKHPLLKELSKHVSSLNFAHFDHLLHARTKDLTRIRFDTEDDFYDHRISTNLPPLLLKMELVSDYDFSTEYLKVAEIVANVSGLSNALRGCVHFLSNSEISVYSGDKTYTDFVDVLRLHDMKRRSDLTSDEVSEIEEKRFDLINLSQKYAEYGLGLIHEARETKMNPSSSNLIPLYFPLTVAEHYLRRLERSKNDMLSQEWRKELPTVIHLKLLRNMILNKY